MKIEIVQGDLFKISCDAIVNPTDVKLSGSGGLDFRIHQKAGLQLRKYCEKLQRNLKPGMVVVTPGFELKTERILHVVSPQCEQEKREGYECLSACYTNLMKMAADNNVRCVAMPLIGTGKGGYSLEKPCYQSTSVSLTAVTILSAIAKFPAEEMYRTYPERMILVCPSEDKYKKMTEAYQWLFGNGISKRERIRGSLLGGAVGDAYGYPVEFQDAVQAWNTDYILNSACGKALISDDTQMTLFTACGLLYAHTRGCLKGISGDIWKYIADAYQDWLITQKLDKNPRKSSVSWIRGISELNVRRAPGMTCLSALEAGGGSVKEPLNDSKGCGGVMRIAPIALYGAANGHWNRKQNGRICAETAAITHGHPLGWLSAVALGNILFDIMQNFSISYTVLDTIAFLEKEYDEYPQAKVMTKLLKEAVRLAEQSKVLEEENLMSALQITERLGEGWVGEEALAVGLFCVLATLDQGFEACVKNAAGHKGDSDSTASIAGQIWGAYFGEKSLPEKWVENVELRDVIGEIAEDLTNDCKMSEFGSYIDNAWLRKYVYCTHVTHSEESPQHVFRQYRRSELLQGSSKTTVKVHPGEKIRNYEIVLKEGKILHMGKTKEDAHVGFSFGFSDLKFDEKCEMYVESHGWYERVGGMIHGYYRHEPFVMYWNPVRRTIELFSETGPESWLGTIRCRTDEWNNPIEIEFKSPEAAKKLSYKKIVAMIIEAEYMA